MIRLSRIYTFFQIVGKQDYTSLHFVFSKVFGPCHITRESTVRVTISKPIDQQSLICMQLPSSLVMLSLCSNSSLPPKLYLGSHFIRTRVCLSTVIRLPSRLALCVHAGNRIATWLCKQFSPCTQNPVYNCRLSQLEQLFMLAVLVGVSLPLGRKNSWIRWKEHL